MHRLILLAAVFNLTYPVVSQSPITRDVTVFVCEGTTLRPVVGLAPNVVTSAGTYSGTTGSTGRAVLTGMTWAPSETEVTAITSASGYLPAVRRLAICPTTDYLRIPVTSRSSGYLTPEIKADTGGSVEIPGVGSVSVPAWALAQDAHLRLIPVVPQASFRFGETGLTAAHFWIEATTSSGQPLPGVMGPGISVDARAWYSWPPGQISLVRRTLNGLTFPELGSATPGGTTENPRVTFEAVEGHNAIIGHYEWDVSGGGLAGLSGCQEWGPWSFTCTVVERKGICSVSIPVNCGVYSGNGSSSISQGDQNTNGWESGQNYEASLSVSIMTALGLSAGASVSMSQSGSVVTTVSETQTVGVTGGVSAGPGYSCFNGTVCLGKVIAKYHITGTRQCVDPPGGGTENGDFGYGWVYEKLALWYENLTFNASCPGCSGATPPSPPTNSPNWP